jgi:hypothetical protein
VKTATETIGGLALFHQGNTMRNLIIAVGACLLGCAHAGATRIGGPDSAPVFDVRCTDSQSACYAEATQLCPNGYEATDSDGYVRPVLVAGSVHSEFHGYIQIKCKAAPAHD